MGAHFSATVTTITVHDAVSRSSGGSSGNSCSSEI